MVKDLVGERIKAYLDERARVLKENLSEPISLALEEGPVGEFVGSFSPIPITETGEKMANRRARARRKLISG